MTALVLVPAYTPPLPEDAHLTLVWPGDDPEPHVRSRLVALMEMFAGQQLAFAAKVMGTGMFGTYHNEPVLLVQPTPELAMMRSALAQFSKSEHNEFRPHVAVPHLGRSTKLPKVLYFNQISFWPRSNGSRDAVTKWLGR